ncbi:MAG: ABC transporter permease [Vicinamibacterales bacterium]
MIWKRLPYLLPWRRRAAERDMREELQSIAAMAAPGELGNLTLAAEDARAEWGWTRLEQLGQDLRYALRTLHKSPIFAATTVLSLAIGIGATTSLFTLIDTVMWRLLPVANPEQLLVLAQRGQTGVSNGFTYQQYEIFRDHVQALEVAAYARAPLNVSIDGQIEPTVDGQLVTGGYFPLLGVQPALGRLFGPDDDRAVLGHPVAVLSHGYWMRRFGGDTSAIGRTLVVSGTAFTIVGVTPAEFFGTQVGTSPGLFLPMMMQPAVMPLTGNLLQRPNVFSTGLRILGRFEANTTRQQATAQLDALAQVPETDWRPRNKFTGQKEDLRLVLTSAATGLSELRRQFSQPLFILLSVAGIVLLIACANVGTLMLARATARRQEFSLRLALGAGRSRLFRQVLVEAGLLAAFGGAAGVALAYWLTRALVAYTSVGQAATALDLSPDVRVLAFTVSASVVAGILVGLAPAVRASRTEVSSDGRRDLAQTRNASAGSGPGGALVAVQVALSVMLLFGAGLFVRSLQNLHRDDSDVDRSRVLVVRVEPRDGNNRSAPGVAERLDRLYKELLDRIERMPGVESASLARTSPLAPSSYSFPVALPVGGARQLPALIVYPGYFRTMGIPVVIGRDFNTDDLRSGSPFAVLVNQAFVREFLGGREPLGVQHGLAEARVAGRDAKAGFVYSAGRPLNIIGVVGDSRFPALREAASPTVYQTFMQANTGFGHMVLHVRTSQPGAALAPRVRDAVQAIDSAVPMFAMHTLADEVDAALVRERLVAALSGGFGLVALGLVSVGLYGLLAFRVSRRSAEIGIRVALGATRSDVLWLVGRQGLTIVLLGLAAGVPAAWITTRLAARQLDTLLYEQTPNDPLAMTAAIVLLLLVAACASLLPARRAARIDPIVALRTE